MREARDIKAPDGFLLGGERLVRQDGTILFQRGWWQVSEQWAGEYVWVHCSTDSGAHDLEVAPPGYTSIYRAQSDHVTIFAARTKRPDAKPGWRKASNIAWHNSRKAAAKAHSGDEDEPVDALTDARKAVV